MNIIQKRIIAKVLVEKTKKAVDNFISELNTLKNEQNTIVNNLTEEYWETIKNGKGQEGYFDLTKEFDTDNIKRTVWKYVTELCSEIPKDVRKENFDATLLQHYGDAYVLGEAMEKASSKVGSGNILIPDNGLFPKRGLSPWGSANFKASSNELLIRDVIDKMVDEKPEEKKKGFMGRMKDKVKKFF